MTVGPVMRIEIAAIGFPRLASRRSIDKINYVPAKRDFAHFHPLAGRLSIGWLSALSASTASRCSSLVTKHVNVAPDGCSFDSLERYLLADAEKSSHVVLAHDRTFLSLPPW